MTTVRNSVCSVALVSLVAVCASCEDQAAPTAPSLPAEQLLDSPASALPNSRTGGGVRSQLSPNQLSGNETRLTVNGLPPANGLSDGPSDIMLEAGPGSTFTVPEPTIPGPSSTNQASSPPDSSILRFPTDVSANALGSGSLPSSDSRPSSESTLQTDETRVTVSNLQTAPDGSTLKVKAVTLLSPINDVETDDLTPLLTVSSAEAQFINQEQLAARDELSVFFELSVVLADSSSAVVDANETTQTTGTTSYQVNATLEETTTYQWRARPKIGDEKGPWSATETF
ncbi:MAG: hypothetical protein VX453_14620, partial [Acidobacteriota bacterium]|nr:hypothetical protein [Acidobacteriota bacterium]